LIEKLLFFITQKRNTMFKFRLTSLAISTYLLCMVSFTHAQTDEPGWAKGRPKTDVAMKMAPVAAFPIPTAANELPINKLKLPPGFKVEVWASGVLDARELRQGEKGNIFVSTLFVGNKVYALPEAAVNGQRTPKVIIDKTEQATGIEFYKGSLFFATNKKIVRYDNVEDKLDNLGEPSAVLTDKLPGGSDHSWKFLRVHDNKLYYNIGAPGNLVDSPYAKIYKMNFDGTGNEVVASGVRNTVGFDFDPKTGNLWFTNNGRDWLSEELPNDTLNVVAKPGQDHFGYPYCHQGNIPDPEFGWGHSCDEFSKPAALLGPHAGTLGLKFYTGNMFPEKYRGAMFIAIHGPWNRTKKYNGVYVAYPNGKGGAKVEPFMTGFVENNQYLGRPVDFLVMKDGSLLVSDDHAGAIYRISYKAS
jgi:glucose/arabinose dehydrogenase